MARTAFREPPRPEPAVTPRQYLSERQAATVRRLLEAASDELNERPYETMTIRGVAERAGVSHVTAYSYFSSKAHLVAEVFWQQIKSLPPVTCDLTAPLAERIRETLGPPGLLLAGQPALSAASLVAVLDPDPDVRRLRLQIGADLADRIRAALGEQRNPDKEETLMLAFTGAMLQAGMGYFDFAGVVERTATVARLIDENRRPEETQPPLHPPEAQSTR
jgi:AcrR family transcriptional regulator